MYPYFFKHSLIKYKIKPKRASVEKFFKTWYDQHPTFYEKNVETPHAGVSTTVHLLIDFHSIFIISNRNAYSGFFVVWVTFKSLE